MLALVVADFKGFVELSIFRCISSFFWADNASLFLLCNQFFINTNVNIFRLFQSSGFAVICLILPFVPCAATK